MRKIKLLIFTIIATMLVTACYDVRIKQHKEWQQYFDEAGVEGCFEYFDNNKELAHYYNLDYCSERQIPGNTFNILLSTLVLDKGLAPDELYTLTWKYNNTEETQQEKSLTLAEAFKSGSIDYFKMLSDKIGLDEVKHTLDTVQYGNNTVDSSNNFWQNGTLLISPDEQVGFIKRLYHSELPFSERAQRITINMMQQEKDEYYALHYITSLNTTNNKPVYWIVGFIEKINVLKHIETKEDQYIPHPYFFTLAINAKDKNVDLDIAGKTILSKIMKEKNLDNIKK